MDDPMDIDSAPLFDPMPTPNEEFCIYRAPGEEPQYLERYGITFCNPDSNARHDDVKFFIWSVFDLEDLGFKVFLDGHYNYKIEAGAEQGVKRFETSEYERGVILCPRTRENLWFLSYRLNQLPSEHVFYPQRPPGLSNIPPKELLKPGDFVDIQEAQMWETEAGKAKQSGQNAPNLPTPQPFYSPDDGIVMYTELEKKLNEVSEALKNWAKAPYRQSFSQLLPTLVGPDAIKRLTMAAQGAASIIQKRDSSQYFRDLVAVPFWQRKKNNAATKITRAHFGLPVEPITDININNAGHDSNDTPMAVERDISQIQKQPSYGTPLDFLDEYTESQMGQPGMIRARPKPENMQYKRLPTDLSDLLVEYEAERMQKLRPRQTCRVGHGDGQIIPDLDFDDSFNFLEKYCMDDTIYPHGMRGGYLPPESSYDSDGFADFAELDNEDGDMELDTRNTEVNKNDADQHEEPVSAPLHRVASRVEKRRSVPGGQPRGKGMGGRASTDRFLNEALEGTRSNTSKARSLPETNKSHRTANGLPPAPSLARSNNGRARSLPDSFDTAEEPSLGKRHELMNECEVYVNAEDRSDAAIQKLCELSGNPACLDKFRSPPNTSGISKLNIDKLRPHLKQLFESGQLNDAAELLGLQPARVGAKDKETLKERDACELVLPIKCRSAKAIRKLFELQGKSDLLAPYDHNEKLDVDKLRPLLPGWVRSRKILDIDGVFNKKWPHKRRILVVKPVKKSLEERLAPKRAMGYDEFRMEREFQVSLPFEWRHPGVKLKFYGIALNAHPELVEKYRGSKRRLCELRLFEDQFDVPTDEDADELIEAGGDPEKAGKEAEEWGEYIRYREEVEAEEEPIRGGPLRGGAGPDEDEDEDEKREDEEEQARREEQVISKTGETDGYSYEWLKEFYSIDTPEIGLRPEKAVARLQALAMDMRPVPLEEYREHDGTLNQEKLRAEIGKVNDILYAHDVPELVQAKAKIPARRQLREWLAFLRNGDLIGPDNLVGAESEPDELYGYPYRFLEDTYEIGKAPEERSDVAIRNHFELGNFMEDEEIQEHYVLNGQLNMAEIRHLYGPWVRNRERDMLDVAMLVRVGLVEGNPRLKSHYKSWSETQNKLPQLGLPRPDQVEQPGHHTLSKTSSDIPSQTTSDISPNQVVYNMDNQKWGDLIALYEISKSIEKCTPEAFLRRLGLAWNADESILVKYWDKRQNRLNFEALREDWGLVKEKLLAKEPGELFRMGATVKGSQAQTAELGKFLRWLKDNPLSPPKENQQSNGGRPENPKQQDKTSSNNAPKTPRNKTPFEIVLGGVEFSPEQWAAMQPTVKKLKDLQAEKKAQSQVPRPSVRRPVLPHGLGSRKPHFAIPDEEEGDEEEDEEMALARIKLNGPKNDTYEGLTARIKRYREESKLKERQKMARTDFVQNRSVHSTEKDMPTVPEFGRGVEEAMTFNGGLPTVYLNNYSLKKIQEIEDENRALQSVVLERAEYCGMCDAYIMFENSYQKDNHYRGHRSNATSCGFCAVSFKGMQDFEMKRHLKKHANEKYGAQDQLVPYRNIDKKTDFPDGDVFRFCNACGVDLNTFPTTQAVLQHTTDCRKEGNSASRQHDKLDGDFYCHKCGENLTFETEPDRDKHVYGCRWRQALGPDGRDSRLWTFASENVPGRASSPELEISRTYFQLLTLVDVTEPRKPVDEDSGEAKEPYNPLCKFHGCRADLGNFARREKLMEHLGAHVGKRSHMRDICPYEECDQDFEDYRKALKKKAIQDGTVYNDRDLGDKIVEHMKKEHNAYYDAANRPCITCLAREVQDGELGHLSGNDAESKKLQEESKRIEAERKKLDEDRKKLGAERRLFEEAKLKEQALRDARKDGTASQPTKTTQKQKMTKEKTKVNGKGTGPANGDGKEDETDPDRTDDDEPKGDTGSEFDPGSEPDGPDDSDDPGNDDGSGAWKGGKTDPKDADLVLDRRPGVFEKLPPPWLKALTMIPKVPDSDIPPVEGMKGKGPHGLVFACRGCGKFMRNNSAAVMDHRTIKPGGAPGCGLDDDMELVVSTKRHMRFFREGMAARGKLGDMHPYLDPPPFLPDAPYAQNLWRTWREILLDPDMNGYSQQIREYLFENSAEMERVKKTTKLPPKKGTTTETSLKKSPYQLARRNNAKAAKAAAKKSKADASASAEASTSADAAAAEAATKNKNKTKKRRRTDGDKDDENEVDETQKTVKKLRRSPRNKNRNTMP